MGVHANIKFNKFPKQGDHSGKTVEVCFGYDTRNTLKGKVIRDDMEAHSSH